MTQQEVYGILQHAGVSGNAVTIKKDDFPAHVSPLLTAEHWGMDLTIDNEAGALIFAPVNAVNKDEEARTIINRTRQRRDNLAAVRAAALPVETVRVLRILEYTGPRKAIEDVVKNSVHGERTWTREEGKVTVRAATLGEFPEILTGQPLPLPSVPQPTVDSNAPTVSAEDIIERAVIKEPHKYVTMTKWNQISAHVNSAIKDLYDNRPASCLEFLQEIRDVMEGKRK